MPPKPKFSKEEIAAAALAIVKESGVEALTARELGSRLGSSARPIFTVFKSMEEVKWAARGLALREFERYISDYQSYTPAFKRVGMQMVSYAVHEPELFKLLFMQGHPQGASFRTCLTELGEMAETCVRLISRDYALPETEARTLFEQMWVHAFGLGALCAMKVCDFTEAEIAEKLGQVFGGMVMILRSGKIKEFHRQPLAREASEPQREASVETLDMRYGHQNTAEKQEVSYAEN